MTGFPSPKRVGLLALQTGGILLPPLKKGPGGPKEVQCNDLPSFNFLVSFPFKKMVEVENGGTSSTLVDPFI